MNNIYMYILLVYHIAITWKLQNTQIHSMELGCLLLGSQQIPAPMQHRRWGAGHTIEIQCRRKRVEERRNSLLIGASGGLLYLYHWTHFKTTSSMPTLPDYPGVFQIRTKLFGLPYGSPRVTKVKLTVCCISILFGVVTCLISQNHIYHFAHLWALFLSPN